MSALKKARQGLEDEVVAPKEVRLEETADGLTVYHDSWPVQIGDNWDSLLEFFGVQDPSAYEVIEDSVKMSKWQTSKGTDTGGRDVLWLYSYKVRFRRKTTEDLFRAEDLAKSIEAVRKYKPKAPSKSSRSKGEPVTYVHAQGDEQSGKSEGGSLEGLYQRETEAVEASVERLADLLYRGYEVTEILDLSTGDRVENIFGHYPSQARTTSTLRSQMAFAVDLDIMRTKAFAEFGLPILKAYTLSNHGEIRQVIGQSPYTSESDNLDLIIAENVRRVLDESPIADQIGWEIPHDEWLTTMRINGVNVALTHGHKSTGRVDQWVLKQRDYLNHHKGFRTDLFVMGHKHHFYAEDVGGTTIIQTPSLEGGSPYFEAGYGIKSDHGLLSFLVGEQFRARFGELTVL